MNKYMIPKYYPELQLHNVLQFGNTFAFDAPTVWNAEWMRFVRLPP